MARHARTALPRPARRHLLGLAAAAALGGLPLGAAADFVWTTGFYVPGTTAPAPIAAADTLRIEAGGFKYLDSANLLNQGTVRWLGDAVYMQNGGSVTNQGLWNAEGDFSLFNNGGAQPTFVNSGNFRKSAGTGTLTVANVGFANSGMVQSDSGTILFSGGSVFHAGSSFAGTGSTRVAQGTNTFNGSFMSSNLQFAGGTVVGQAAVVNGHLDYNGGTLTGTWAVAAGQTLGASSGAFKYLDGSSTVLTNLGRIDWATPDALYLQNGATLRNQALFEAGASTSLVYNGGAQPAFVNTATGTLRAAAGQTLAVGNIGFSNQGGTVEALAGATVRFTHSGSSFGDGSNFTGAGTVRAEGSHSFAGNINAGNLVLASGTHTGVDAHVRNNLLFSGGVVSGSWTVDAGQQLSGRGGGFKYLDGAATVLTNRGLISWDTADALYMQNGARLVNEGVLLATTSTQLLANGGAQPVLRNTASGVLRADAGQLLTIGAVALTNDGGQLDAGAGAALRYTGNNASFNDGSRFTGAGENQVVSNAVFRGVQQSGNLVLAAGSFTGDGAVAQGLLRWTGGTLTGDWTVAAGHQLQASAGGFKYLDGAGTQLRNPGTLAVDAGEALYLQNGATLHNSGLLQGAAGSALLYNGGVQTTLLNTGTLRATAGNVTIGAVGLQNQGGVLQADAGAALVFSGGNASFGAGSQFTGAGRNLVTSNASFSGAQQSQNLALFGGTATGQAAVLNGLVRWHGGTVTGGWQVAAGQQLQLAAGGFKYLDGSSTTLHNLGSMVLDAGEAMYLQNGATLRNAGTLTLNDGSGVLYNGGAGVQVINTGLVHKTTGAGMAALGNGTGLQNLGTVAVDAGTLALPANFSNAGLLAGSGQFSTNLLRNDGTVAPGAALGGDLGTLQLAGSFAQALGGALALQLGGGVGDQFLVSGAASLGGTLALACAGGCALAMGQSYLLLDAGGDLTGSFDTVTTSGFGQGFAYDLVYDRTAEQVRLQVLQVGAVPEPGTWLMLLAGLGLLALPRRRLPPGLFLQSAALLDRTSHATEEPRCPSPSPLTTT